MAGEAGDGRVLTAQLPDRPRDGAGRDRTARGDQTGHLFHERPAAAIVVDTPPHLLPPHDSNPSRTGHVMQDPAASAATDRDDATRGAAGRAGRRRHRHGYDALGPLDMLHHHPLEAEQHVATGTRNGSRARVSAPRTKVRHVEVLGSDQVG